MSLCNLKFCKCSLPRKKSVFVSSKGKGIVAKDVQRTPFILMWEVKWLKMKRGGRTLICGEYTSEWSSDNNHNDLRGLPTCRRESRPGRLVKVRQKPDCRQFPFWLDNRENRSINLESSLTAFINKKIQQFATALYLLCVRFSGSFCFHLHSKQSGNGNLINFFPPFSTAYSFSLFSPSEYQDRRRIVCSAEFFFIQSYQAVLLTLSK